MKKLKIVQYGCGKMSVYTMRYAVEKGHDIVGALDIDQKLIGKDIGEIFGDKPYGVKITDVKDGEELLKEVKPDICIITTMSLMNDVKDSLLLCAKLGINAITTCEEAFYPFNSSPNLSKEIDELAKKNDCTITGCGYQDVAWGNLIAVLAGTTHNITKIKGSSSYNVEDYGIALAKAHGAGLTLDEFEKEVASNDNISEEERNKQIENGEFFPSYMWNTNGWICDRLGLTVKRQTQTCVPTINDGDLYSSTLDLTIEKGDVTGMSAIVTTETEEGIVIESECIGKVYNEEEFDRNTWTVEGEPTTKVTVDRPATVELTCADIVNRLEDVVASVPGFIPTSQMDISKYKIN